MAHKLFEKPFPFNPNEAGRVRREEIFLGVFMANKLEGLKAALPKASTGGGSKNRRRDNFFERIRYTHCLVTLQADFFIN
ncbi:MAG: hypothetical protein M3384_04765 [Acidobacteriota bacterium]|nr:hypothetical protein [Acidobacteriota bacterium]